MTGYVVVPRGSIYWIVWTEVDGSLRPVGRFEREDMAVWRLHELQAEAEASVNRPSRTFGVWQRLREWQLRAHHRTL